MARSARLTSCFRRPNSPPAPRSRPGGPTPAICSTSTSGRCQSTRPRRSRWPGQACSPSARSWPDACRGGPRHPTAVCLGGPHALLMFSAICVRARCSPAADPGTGPFADPDAGDEAVTIMADLLAHAEADLAGPTHRRASTRWRPARARLLPARLRVHHLPAPVRPAPGGWRRSMPRQARAGSGAYSAAPGSRSPGPAATSALPATCCCGLPRQTSRSASTRKPAGRAPTGVPGLTRLLTRARAASRLLGPSRRPGSGPGSRATWDFQAAASAVLREGLLRGEPRRVSWRG